MEQRLEITTKSTIRDVTGEQLSERIKKTFSLDIKCRSINVYNFGEKLPDSEMDEIARDVFLDSVTQSYSIKEPLFSDCWRIEIGMLPGVTDNVGATASSAVKDRIGKSIPIYHVRMYALKGNLDEVFCEKVAGMLHNSLVEKYSIHPPSVDPPPYLPEVKISTVPTVQKISLHMGKERFEILAKERILSLSHEEFAAIKKYFKLDSVVEERKKLGLDSKITDVELEAIAQTWSEHCKHKIFNALISYDEDGAVHAINSLFSTFIKGATAQIKKPYVVSVFKDNGGIIKFNHEYDIAVKVETHNAPSALDPYGGSLTGILGVQRDIMGTGLGANPIANIDVLCFGYPDSKPEDVPRGVRSEEHTSELQSQR